MGSIDFCIGKKLQHKYTKEILWVLRKGKEQVLCRTTDLREIWFYIHELEEVSEIRESTNRSNRFL